MSEILSQGCVLKRGDGAGPEVFTAVGQVTKFTGPGGSATVIDASNLDSTAKEKMMGLRDEGSYSFDINYDPADTQHQGLIADRAAKVLRNFKVVLSDDDDSEIAFSGFVLGFQIQGAVDDLVTASVTIEISGAVTWPS